MHLLMHWRIGTSLMTLWFYRLGVFGIILEDRFIFENIWIFTGLLHTLIASTVCLALVSHSLSRTSIALAISHSCMSCTCWSPLQCNKFDLSTTNIFNCINTVLSSALSIQSRCFSEYLSFMSLFIIHSASFSRCYIYLTTFKNGFCVYNSKNTHIQTQNIIFWECKYSKN